MRYNTGVYVHMGYTDQLILRGIDYMSASAKKKLRKEQNIAQLTERQLQEQKEAKKLKLTTAVFVIVMAAVLIAGLVLIGWNVVKSSGIVEKSTTALTVGDHKLNSVEMTYYFHDTINQWQSQYGDYASIFGLDTTKPLNTQSYGEEGTWADYFLEQATQNAKADYALYDKAIAEGYTVDEEIQSSIDTNMSTYSLYAAFNQVDIDTFLKLTFGNGASEKSLRKHLEVSAIATTYYQDHQESLTYDDAAIRDYEKDSFNDYSSFSYANYYLPVSSFEAEDATESTDEAVEATEAATEEATEEVTEAATEEATEEVTEAATEEATEASEETAETTGDSGNAADAAKAAAESLLTATTQEELDAAIAALAINAESTTAASTKAEDTLYTNISTIYREWLAESGREKNDIQLFADESTTTGEDGTETTTVKGYYVVMYLDSNDNAQPMSNVRHLLVQFEGGTTDENGTTTYSDEEKAAAKSEAEGYLKQWQDGEKTQDSFIALVKEHSDDTSASEGGLFEDINPASSYVENFLNWSIDDSRKAGDAEVIETEYGYHVMYYVGDDEMTYRDYMITNEMRTSDMETWYNSILESVTVSEGNFKRIRTDLVLSSEG